MGKPTGFMEYKREVSGVQDPKSRIGNFDEFHTPLSEEKQRQQGARCMACGVPFCQSGVVLNGMVTGCPLHNLIPEWNDLVYTGNWEQAYRRLKKTNNFPEFTARVCPAPCEAACTCGLNDSPVAIKENEYGIVEHAYAAGYADANPPRVRTGKKVAVIGSGPAGLAAADQLNKRGHQVTVFERSDRVGGLLMYGIPNMKLDKKIIERKIRIMREEGVEFITNADVGAGPKSADTKAGAIKAADIMKQYDRVILACGASNPRDLKVPGRDAKGIHFAVDFLRSTTKSLLDSGLTDGNYISAKSKKVMVIGGGDTGNDCVGTAIRHGAGSVIQLEMMPKLPDERSEDNTWPEWPKVCKTDYGQEEAIARFGQDPRVYQTTVKEFLKDKNGNVCKARLVSLEPKKDGKTGRIIMVEVPGSETLRDVDLVLIAAGFLGAQKSVADAFKVKLNERTNVDTAPGRYRTNVENVFTAGDMHRGQSLVVWAIREGREAAREVDESLMGYTNLYVQ
ncbi:glutamate synthase subunit beta [Diplocloster agilis]|uniref:glutamate synthase subunit beta n=1 Tax=Diplocloster agilis TaxID=2850323 RepID=UPI000822D2A8|nr:glutamate synthase subunit beta [Suonthocola fibrivorans]MCU6732608.1 glutamate synthase subunit beta [Suonthocola fibrivorans]SCI54621.1 Glutamate synthase [NADPH] small chain [uncultured Clostridium sp.]